MTSLVPHLGFRHDDASLGFLTGVLGFAVVTEPTDTEWGTRRARIRDLDGHDWSLGNVQPGQAW